MLSLNGRQSFSQSVSCHVVCRTIDQFDCTPLDYVANKMIPNIDVLGSGMIMTVVGKKNSRLAITK